MHGSDMDIINTGFDGSHTIMSYELSMSEMRAVDQINQRCSDEEEPPNLSKCLVESIESRTNCSLQLLWSDKDKEKCNVSRTDDVWQEWKENGMFFGKLDFLNAI